jgi:hypothetical protein
MTRVDIIGDIHGHLGALTSLLTKLGYRRTDGTWRHDDARAIFVGDLIDKGPQPFEVLALVRRMVESANAELVIGNHELNWIRDAAPFQHNLDKFLLATGKHADRKVGHLSSGGAINLMADFRWLRHQPLYIDRPELRVVHAAWSDEHLSVLRDSGVMALDDHGLSAYLDTYSPAYFAIDFIVAGCDHSWLQGDERKSSRYLTRRRRVHWWPDIGHKVNPIDVAAERISNAPYAQDAPPVFFGHFAFAGQPRLAGPNVVGVDYSVAYGGPLAAYSFDAESVLNPQNFVLSD